MKQINYLKQNSTSLLFETLYLIIKTVSKKIISFFSFGSFTLKTILAFTFMSITVLCNAQLILDSCHTKARLNYPLIKQYGLIEQAKNYNISNANKAYLPQLDVSIIGGILEGIPSMGAPGTEESGLDMKMISMVQLNQVIWDGGITKAQKKAIEANSEISKANLDVSTYALEDRVNNLYFGILLIDEQLTQFETLLSTLNRNYKRAETAMANGTAFASDLDEIKVEIINTEQKQANLVFNRKAYLNVLSAMIGESISENVVLKKPQNAIALLSDSIQRPELKLFKNQQLLIQSQQDINKAMLYPKLGLMGFGTFIQPGVDFGTSSLDNILVAGLSLNWNLGSLYKHSNNKKLVKLDLNKIAVQQETFLFNTNMELSQHKVEILRCQNQIEKDKELLTLKKRIKEAYDVKYKNGTCTMSALLDRVNEESIAQQNLAVNEIQLLLKVYQYQIITGNRILNNN